MNLAAPTLPATQIDFDAHFMAVALALGARERGRTWPNPAVGAVVVQEKGGTPVVVGRGWTQAGGRPHAETEALRRAGAATRGATLYVTLEPCSHHGRTPPCADAIAAAGIARVVSAIEDPNPLVAGQGHARLRAAGIAVDVGVGAPEARRAHAGHTRRIRDARPHVALKLAVSADGKVGLFGRRPAVITGETTRARVHRMRADHDAVLTGIGTVLSDDPLLTCRLPGMAGRSPVRVVLDTHLQMPLASKLVRSMDVAPVWVVAGPVADAAREFALSARGITVLRMGTAGSRIDLAAAVHELAARGITRLMVEAGPTLAAALLRAELVDKAVVFRSPMTVGPEGLDALDGLPLEALTHSPHLSAVDRRASGDDIAETFERAE